MTLASQMVDDVSLVFLNTDDHAIDILYVSALVGNRRIKAIKTENNGGPQDQRHVRTMDRRATFAFSDDANEGVETMNELDYIQIIQRNVTQKWTLSKIVSHEAGMWTIECVYSTLTHQGMKQGNSY